MKESSSNYSVSAGFVLPHMKSFQYFLLDCELETDKKKTYIYIENILIFSIRW